MEVKKSPEADLERKRPMWLLIGYVMVLAALFVALEWSERDITFDTSQTIADLVFEEEIEIPVIEQPKPITPPPPVAPPAVADVLTIVDDEIDVEENITFSSEEEEESDEIDYIPITMEEEEPAEAEIYELIEEMPQFPGGLSALMRYLGRNIKYPEVAYSNGIQGCVMCQFLVNEDGSISDEMIVRGIDPDLDKEALRVISSMPNWVPGKLHGKPVRVRYTLPVMFRLK